MPKHITIEERRGIEAQAIIEELINSEGVRVRHQLTQRIADLPPGTWIFGTLQLGGAGEVAFKYDGHSTPPGAAGK
jgi:hypothetical protein